MCNFVGREYFYDNKQIAKNDQKFVGYEDLEKYPDTPSHREQFPELYNFTFNYFSCFIYRGKNWGEWRGYIRIGDFWRDDFKDIIDPHHHIHFLVSKEYKIVEFSICSMSPFSTFPSGHRGEIYYGRDYVVNKLKDMSRRLLLLLPKWSPDTHKQFPLPLRKSIWEIYKIWYLRKQSKNFSKILQKDIWIDIINYLL